MKTLYSCLLCAVSMQLISTGICNAQSTALPLKVPAGPVTIDGQGGEWGDTLSYYNAEKKIRYTISNDKDNLYLVVKAKDAIQESNILIAGITLTIDTKGRKKSSFVTTFPSNGESTIPVRVTKAGEETLEQKAMRAKYLKFKKIAVNGFRDISDDYITTSNTYGIKVGIDYDDKGNLVYEEAIPLELFHAGDLAKTEWSFNIKLNGLEKSGPQAGAPTTEVSSSGGGGGGRGGKGGGHKDIADPSTKMAMGGGELTPTLDFWGKFLLAKP